jgi:tRNA uridine 5-carboxymethylaminomethyl modification enzyme
MIDDLITRGTNEPYRMFTSRAEYRLLLREDNADLRLTETGRELGLVDATRWRRFCAKRDAVAREQQRLERLWVRPGDAAAEHLAQSGERLSSEQRVADLLRRPGLSYAGLMALEGIGPGCGDDKVAEQVEIQARYHGYIERQREEIERQMRNEHKRLPENLDYAQVKGLSAEVREKLSRVAPQTIGQAARIPGMTPAAISLLLVHLKKTGPARKSA